MNEKDRLNKEEGAVRTDEAMARGSHRHWDVLAALVCILLAFMVWLCVMNVRDTQYLSLETTAPQRGYTYELSAGSLEVEGTVVALKRAEHITVILPENVEDGVTVTLTEQDLILPEGVSLVSTLRLTVTVSAQ